MFDHPVVHLHDQLRDTGIRQRQMFQSIETVESGKNICHLNWNVKTGENKQKEAGIGPFFLKKAV